MRYQLLQPTAACDPRFGAYKDAEALHQDFRPIGEYGTEAEAVAAARAIFPDAIHMLVPGKIGSGQVVFMGLLRLQAGQMINADLSLPFVMLARALGDDLADKRRIKEMKQFTQQLWKQPLITPRDPVPMKIEVRSSQLQIPNLVDAQLGRDPDAKSIALRFVIDGNDVSISMPFHCFCPMCDHHTSAHELSDQRARTEAVSAFASPREE